MSELKHTKGPWKGVHGEGINKNGNHHIIAENKNIAIITKSKNDVANSLLIACAPEMLKMLLEVYKTIEDDDSDNWWLDSPDNGGFDADKIKEIIEKATNQKIEDLL